MKPSIGFLIYDGVSLADFVPIYGFFASSVDIVSVCTVGRTKEIVRCHGGLQILPDDIYPDASIYEAIVLPGGPGWQEAASNLRLVNWITRAARLARVVAAVGQGNFLAGGAGLLDGKPVPDVQGLVDAYPGAEVTGLAGPTGSGNYTGIAGAAQWYELSLTIARRLLGVDDVRKLANAAVM